MPPSLPVDDVPVALNKFAKVVVALVARFVSSTCNEFAACVVPDTTFTTGPSSANTNAEPETVAKST